MSFAEPGLEGLASLVLCFATEGSGLSLAAFIILPAGDVGVVEVDYFDSLEANRKIRKCHCRLNGRPGFVHHCNERLAVY